jgi:hypothetical protein
MTEHEAPSMHEARSSDNPLRRAVDADHAHILAALDDQRTPLDVVVWASAHLATVQRLVYPVAERAGLRTEVGELYRRGREIERLLRLLEQHHSGDVLAVGLDSAGVRRRLRELLNEHADAERELIDAVVATLPAERQDELAAAYWQRFQRAPSRPHPHAPHRGVLAAAAFWIDSVRDRVLDVLDARHVPSPRPTHRTSPPGRWGLYLLGQARPPDQRPRD